jgi:arylformamidase
VIVCCSPLASASRANAATSQPRILKNVPFADGVRDARRSLDLYLPATNKPPLLIFVHGGFWLLSDDDYRIGVSLAENLVREGVAVALVRYRLAPTHRHPSQAQDVAAAVAHLVKSAERYGYDTKRIFLSGHSAGGHLAALVALDKSYLSEHKVTGEIAGVISFSGLYDLLPSWKISENQRSAVEKTFGNSPGVLKQASPVAHVRRAAPPFLILTAVADFPGFATDGRRFADRLRAAGAKGTDQQMFKGADHFSLIKLDGENNPVRRAVLGFMGVKPVSFFGDPRAKTQ